MSDPDGHDQNEGQGGNEQDATTENAVMRQQGFTASGPVEVDLAVGSGRIEVQLSDEPGIHVTVQHDPSAASPWASGFSSLLGWVNDQFGGQFGDQFSGRFGDQFGGQSGGQSGAAAEAVRQTRIDLTGQRLVVHTPKAPALRHVPLAVTIAVPSGSHLDVHSGTAALTTTGAAGRVTVRSGTGDITVQRADGTAAMQTGSGALRLGPMLAGLRARSGSGDIEVSSVAGTTSLITGTGDVWLGAVCGEVMARTGSGDLTVADAASGQLELITGSGEIRVGVRLGTLTQVDLSSGSGQARSELDVHDDPPEGSEAALRVRGRTGSGNAVVTTAVG